HDARDVRDLAGSWVAEEAEHVAALLQAEHRLHGHPLLLVCGHGHPDDFRRHGIPGAWPERPRHRFHRGHGVWRGAGSGERDEYHATAEPARYGSRASA